MPVVSTVSINMGALACSSCSPITLRFLVAHLRYHHSSSCRLVGAHTLGHPARKFPHPNSRRSTRRGRLVHSTGDLQVVCQVCPRPVVEPPPDFAISLFLCSLQPPVMGAHPSSLLRELDPNCRAPNCRAPRLSCGMIRCCYVLPPMPRPFIWWLAKVGASAYGQADPTFSVSPRFQLDGLVWDAHPWDCPPI